MWRRPWTWSCQSPGSSWTSPLVCPAGGRCAWSAWHNIAASLIIIVRHCKTWERIHIKMTYLGMASATRLEDFRLVRRVMKGILLGFLTVSPNLLFVVSLSQDYCQDHNIVQTCFRRSAVFSVRRMLRPPPAIYSCWSTNVVGVTINCLSLIRTWPIEHDDACPTLLSFELDSCVSHVDSFLPHVSSNHWHCHSSLCHWPSHCCWSNTSGLTSMVPSNLCW